METQAQLNELASEIIRSNITPDLALQAIQLVMGSGNPNADVVFIGEAPGKKEDETGLPFVGAAGKFLDSLLESVGMSRDDVYITNIVKYRPPNNRDPSPSEKAEFAPYLAKQLEIIAPKVVIALGRHSMEFFLPSAKISEVHGQPHDVSFNGLQLKVLPLYHPAAALYNGSLRHTLFDDFAIVPTLLTPNQ